MCVLCGSPLLRHEGLAERDFNETGQPVEQHVDASTARVSRTGIQGVDGVLSGTRWSTSQLTFSNPDQAADYADYAAGGVQSQGFAQISAAQLQAARFSLDQDTGGAFSVEGFTLLDIAYAGTGNADIRIGQSTSPATAYAYYPSTSSYGGDVWFGTTYSYRDPRAGNYAYHTMMHELGHALGLKHGHETNVYGAVPAANDSLEYTIMTYRSHVGDTLDGYGYERWGAPQSFMMYDIAALQAMYGADYSTNAGDTVYSWRPDSGSTLINGAEAISPGANRIFLTIWDGGGVDTYDLSAYSTSLSIDLSPGSHSSFSAVQTANLGNGNYSRGNVFNALLADGNTASLIENARGGSAADTLTGNQGANVLTGNGGDDTIFGGDGNDTLRGDAGNDQLSGDAGIDGIMGGLGNDMLSGGAQGDYLYGEDGNDRLAGDAGIDALFGGAGDDTVYGGADGDYLYGGDGRDDLQGGDGNDAIFGEGGADYLHGEGGTDYLYAGAEMDALFGGDGRDFLYGESAADHLHGDAGDDQIEGGTGADSLFGGTGNDILYGGSDGDYFYFIGSFGRDAVGDFARGEGDRLVFSAAVSQLLGYSYDAALGVSIFNAGTDVLRVHGAADLSDIVFV